MKRCWVLGDRCWGTRIVLVLVVVLVLDARGQDATEILKASGVKGGLVVHLGCGDGRLTAALRTSESYLVHGLDADARNVEAARKHIQSLGLYGPVSVDQLRGGRLPYAENLVNLVVAEALGSVPMAEVMRVLAPGGVAYVGGKKTVKPRPKEIAEWTHYLYDASNNAVSPDSVVGPPRRLQWLGSPRWARHHDHMASTSAMVSANGRIFYIFDEGSTASVVLPSSWWLIARDAFNGTVLWRRPIEKWFTQLWPLKSGPALLTRRLVAVGDEVYVTLGLDAPATALDAATGKTLRTYKESAGAEEIIASDGTLFLVVNKQPETRWGGSRASVAAIRAQVQDPRWGPGGRTLLAANAATGEVFWRKDTAMSPSTLAADAERVYYHDGQKVVALDRRSGSEAWASEPLPIWAPKQFQSWFVPALVVYRGVVLWAGGEKMVPHRGGQDRMAALDARTGKTLWSAEHGPTGYQSAEDLLVAGGLVWSGATTSGGYDGIYRGYDPRTGELRSEFPPDVKAYWFHHRCYRGKATERYLLPSRTGIEFVDIARKSWEIHHWVRGGCLYGIMPANGLLYNPPHDCACYPEAKLFGFNALAAASASAEAARAKEPSERLERGPAYEPDGRRPAADGRREDWPTYRGGAARHGSTASPVPAELKPAWERTLGGPLTSVVVADGKLFVAAVDAHTLHALDAATGEPVWSFTAGGRIDSPPTIWQGLCIFGSADGSVYCLRAADGALAWRFLAAPVDERHVAFEQLESVWPVHGSVLVQDGVAWFTAGRSMFLDGGLRLYRLDARSGRVLSTSALTDKDPEADQNLQFRHQVLNMPVALPDVLSSDGKRVYMRSQVFDLVGKRLALGPHSGDPAGQGSVQRGEEAHLFAPYGFLDCEWFHRSYWVYGRSFAGGHAGYYQAGKFAPAGRILVADAARVYGYARKPQYLRWTTPLEYHLFATSTEPPEVRGLPGPAARRGITGSWVQVDKTESQNPAGKPLAVEAWVNAERPNGIIVARGGPAQGYALFLRGGLPHFAIRAASKPFAVAGNQKAVGRWVHLAGVLTAEKKLEVYVDGKLAGTAEAGAFIAADPAQEMQIGADADSGEGVADYTGPFPFTGLIDEVRVYHGALTAAEIARHAANPADTEAKDAELVLHFDFEKGAARDKSGNNNHGALGGVKPEKGKLGDALRFTGRGTGAAQGSHLVKYYWSNDAPPIAARAMALAGPTLFVAGPPDVLDEDAAVKALDAPDIQKALAEQDAALRGEKGALLLAYSAADGKLLAEHKLASPPAWDAMAAAGGRLFLATQDGKVLCFGGKE